MRPIATAYLPKHHHSWGHASPSFSRITDGKSHLHGAAQAFTHQVKVFWLFYIIVVPWGAGDDQTNGQSGETI